MKRDRLSHGESSDIDDEIMGILQTPAGISPSEGEDKNGRRSNSFGESITSVGEGDEEEGGSTTKNAGTDSTGVIMGVRASKVLRTISESLNPDGEEDAEIVGIFRPPVDWNKKASDGTTSDVVGSNVHDGVSPTTVASASLGSSMKGLSEGGGAQAVHSSAIVRKSKRRSPILALTSKSTSGSPLMHGLLKSPLMILAGKGNKA
jgi:hypothetical protein